ncbi:MAG: hypothetical protein ACRDDY_12080 [Clostridium sp.]|uniref:hypothetical protein n=1 Tax=Clostridium sp. TaxID=1506 RepID=UPI003EE80096
MIQIFCSERGAGKTKKLIEKANEYRKEARGNIIFIDDDSTNARLVNREIRFISTEEFKIEGCIAFYGFLCGILSNDYDIEHVYIDGLLSIVQCSLEETRELFFKLSKLCEEYSVKIFINVNNEKIEDIPRFIKEYA